MSTGMKKMAASMTAIMLLFANTVESSVGISLSPGTWNVTQSEPGGRGGHKVLTSPQTYTVTNSGTDPATVKIKASNSQNWTLGSSAGENIFSLKWGTDPNWNSVLTTNSKMINSLNGQSNFSFNLKYESPTDISPDKALNVTQISTITVSVEPVIVAPVSFNLVSQWPLNNMEHYYKISYDRQNYKMYATAQGQVREYSANGSVLNQWNTGWGYGIYYYSGSVYVAAGGDNPAIDSGFRKYSIAGVLALEKLGWGANTGQFKSPHDITVDDKGNIYVLDTINARVQKFNSSGDFVTSWGKAGSNPGEFGLLWDTMGPEGIAFDPKEQCIYVADLANNRVQKFGLDGTFLLAFGQQGTGDGNFMSPMGVSVGPNGLVYVADTVNRYVKVFYSDGTFITKIGFPSVSNIADVEIDDSGHVYVLDNGGYKIHVYAPAYQ